MIGGAYFGPTNHYEENGEVPRVAYKVIQFLTCSLLSLLAAFVLLYPFYLRDTTPARYKGIWQSIGSAFGNRYGAIYALNIYWGLNVGLVVGIFTEKSFIPFMAVLLYILLFTLVFLWYPFHLKEKKPEKYKGVWKRIGEWMGDPRDAFPNLRK